MLPAADLRGDFLTAFQPGLALAAQLVMGGAFGQHGHPCGLDGHFDVFNFSAGGVEIAQIGHGFLGFLQAFAGGKRLLLVAGHGEGEGFLLALGHALFTFGTAERTGGIGHGTVRIAAGLAGGAVLGGELFKLRGQVLMGGAGAVGIGGGAFDALLEFLETIELLQAQSGGRWRVFGIGAEAVPAPEVPFDRDQTLAGFQVALQARPVGGVDQTHLAHAAGEHLGDGHVRGQCLDACGQVLRGGVAGQKRPAGGLAWVDLGRAQVVGEGGPEGFLEPGFHLHHVEQLGAVGGVAFDQFGECGGFGPQGIGLAFGLGALGAGGFFAGLRLAAFRVDFGQGRVGFFGQSGGGGGGGLRGGQVRACFGDGFCGLGHCGAGLGGLALVAVQRFDGVFLQAVRRLVAGRQAGHVFGLLRQGGFAVGEDVGRLARVRACLIKRVGVAVGGLGEFFFFPFEPLDGFACVLVQRSLAFNVLGQLRDAAGEGLDGARGLRFLVAERVALDLKTLQDRGGDGLFFAQGRQGGVLGFAQFGRFTRLTLGLGGHLRAFGQLGGGGGASLVGLFPAAIEQQAFGAAQLVTNFAVARGLFGLAGELGQLGGELFEHVFDAGEVGFGAIQLQLRLVTPLIEAGDACGFLKDAAAGFGAGVDQLRDLSLPDERGGMRPGGGVGKEHLHIAGAHVFAVGFVSRPCVTGDAADDLKIVEIVEPRRGQPLGIVDLQGDFGKVAGGAGHGTCENHVLHAGAAHGFGAVLAHDPAQGLQQVRLAAAIWPDHAGQPVGNDQLRGVHEAFEAVQSEFRKAHGRWVHGIGGCEGLIVWTALH